MSKPEIEERAVAETIIHTVAEFLALGYYDAWCQQGTGQSASDYERMHKLEDIHEEVRNVLNRVIDFSNEECIPNLIRFACGAVLIRNGITDCPKVMKLLTWVDHIRHGQ